MPPDPKTMLGKVGCEKRQNRLAMNNIACNTLIDIWTTLLLKVRNTLIGSGQQSESNAMPAMWMRILYSANMQRVLYMRHYVYNVHVFYPNSAHGHVTQRTCILSQFCSWPCDTKDMGSISKSGTKLPPLSLLPPPSRIMDMGEYMGGLWITWGYRQTCTFNLVQALSNHSNVFQGQSMCTF